MDGENSRLNGVWWLIIALLLTTVVAGFFGWLDVFKDPCATTDPSANPYGDALYRSLTPLVLPDSFEGSDYWCGNPLVELARWTGLATFVLLAIKAFLVLAADRGLAFFAHQRKGHIVLIGSDPVGEAITTAALAEGLKVTWLAASAEQASLALDNLYVTDAAWTLQQASRFNMHKAKSIAVITDDDIASLSIGRDIARFIKDVPKTPALHISVNTPWIALRIEDLIKDLGGLEQAHMFSRAQTSVRQLHKRFPPFLVASDLSRQSVKDIRRIHSVIIGFDAYAEAILIDTLLTCLTTDLEPPRITIIDACADQVERAIAFRYPELHKSFDLVCVTGTIEGSQQCLEKADLQAIGADDPITGLYVCGENDIDSVSTAMALNALSMREDWSDCPIFVRLSVDGALPGGTDVHARTCCPSQLIQFGVLSHLGAATGVLSDALDQDAKRLHEMYLSIPNTESKTQVQWADLPEDKRASNRRIMMHLPAKLHSAGYDIGPWLAAPHVVVPHAAHGLFASVHDADYEALASLEHDRWAVDRRINGYVYAPEEEAGRRRHSDLIDFDALGQASKKYDYAFIDMLDKELREAPKDIVLEKRLPA